MTATVDKMIFPDLLPSEIVQWQGFSNAVTGKAINFTPKKPGTLTITSKIKGKGSTQTINVVQPIINDIQFTDSNGSKIDKAGWGQNVNIRIDHKGLDNEKLTIVLWDSDTVQDDPVKTITIKAYDGGLIPVTLDADMKNKAGNQGLIYVKISAPDVVAVGEGLPFPKTYKLDVQDKKEIFNAKLGSEDGSEKHTVVDYDEVSYFYANSRGIKPDEVLFLEIRDSVVGRDPLLLQQVNVKADQNGIIKQKIIWNNIKNKVNLLTVYAMIKEKNKDGKVLYDADGDFSMATAKLRKGSTLVKVVENKGAVKVGDEKANNKGETACICKNTNLIWGGHKAVSCEFRKKVIEISKRQNFDPNDLMAVMKVETSGTFSASKIELKETKEKRRDGKFKKEYRGLTKDEILQLSESFAGAVGLIQFTPVAIKSLNANYNLSLTKRKLALMSQLEQLDYVEKYIELWKKTKNITGKISLSDLYVLVFAPNYFGSSDDTTLYKEGSDYYIENASVDTDGKNGITKNEIAARAISSKSEGAAYKVSKFSCGNTDNSNNSINAKDIVTFHIYADGKIEKHIPKAIKEEYKQKYKYVFHDKESKEHEICITEWHTTSKKLPSRSKLNKKPTHSKVISDENVNEGQTKRRVIYENGDIAEYGSNRGDSFWRLYSATKESIELVKMPDTVKYINYSFSGTKRIYTGPNYFAGFIGALAVTGFSVTTTGSCFREGSCFPSQFHVNGESVDTIYFWKLETDQKFINAMKFFHFGERKVGNDAYFKKLKDVSDGGDLHDSHLHCGEFDSSKVIEIKEK